MKKKITCLLVAFCLLLTGCGATKEDVENVIDDNYRMYYEVFVYSFADSDGDGIGDLNGLTGKLDYIEDLGCNGIWLMPIMPSTTYHKYDVIDYFDIDKQPLLPLKNGENRYYVLSVGNVENGCPVVTVEGDIENMCYRLPCELSDWALTVTGLSMMGEKFFPTDVIFTKEKDEVKVDVLGERS